MNNFNNANKKIVQYLSAVFPEGSYRTETGPFRYHDKLLCELYELYKMDMVIYNNNNDSYMLDFHSTYNTPIRYAISGLKNLHLNIDEEYNNDKLFQLSLMYDMTIFVLIIERVGSFSKFISDIQNIYNEYSFKR